MRKRSKTVTLALISTAMFLSSCQRENQGVVYAEMPPGMGKETTTGTATAHSGQHYRHGVSLWPLMLMGSSRGDYVTPPMGGTVGTGASATPRSGAPAGGVRSAWSGRSSSSSHGSVSSSVSRGGFGSTGHSMGSAST